MPWVVEETEEKRHSTPSIALPRFLSHNDITLGGGDRAS